MELDELVEVLSEYAFDEEEPYSFLCHLTQRDNVRSICENGLFLDNDKLTSTAIMLEESFYDNPSYFIEYELGNPQTRKKEVMILMGCPSNEIDSLVKRNYDEDNEYVIRSENIIGSIDLDTLYFEVNPNSELEIESQNSL